MTKKDKKGRNLYKGERQRKDGRYEYRYTNSLGKQKSVYSWRLVESDATPAGKPREKALREIERSINKDLFDGIISTDITLNSYFDIFMETKQELKENTWVSFKEDYQRYFQPGLGDFPIESINYTMIKRHYITIIQNHHLALNTMRKINNILHQVFESAIKDDLVRTNPTNGVLKGLKRIIPPSSTRTPLTREEQTVFLNYVATSPRYKKWYSLFLFLLCTGCRIGEAAGLRWDDCDFENNEIHIKRTQAYGKRKNGDFGLIVNTPKTKTSRRTIPMMTVLKEVLLQERGTVRFKKNGDILQIDDERIVFHNAWGNSITSSTVDLTIHRICAAYNQQESALALEEGRNPLLLPHFTAHSLRHTFCTRYSETETNIRAIMEIMGHSDIATTMNIYSKATTEVKKTSMQELENKVFVGQSILPKSYPVS